MTKEGKIIQKAFNDRLKMLYESYVNALEVPPGMLVPGALADPLERFRIGYRFAVKARNDLWKEIENGPQA